jgi:hypothetical protein
VFYEKPARREKLYFSVVYLKQSRPEAVFGLALFREFS